jgi:hypothetical protein
LDPAGNLVEVYKHKVVQKTADSTSDGKQIKTPAFTGRNKVGTTWSPEEEQQLRKAFATHKPITEIAATHGRTAAAITARLAKLGLVT